MQKRMQYQRVIMPTRVYSLLVAVKITWELGRNAQCATKTWCRGFTPKLKSGYNLACYFNTSISFKYIGSERYLFIHAQSYFTLMFVKGALDKYNIYLCISNSVENLKLSQYRIFSADSANEFFILWGILWIASSPECPIGYCNVYLLKLTLKNRKNARNIHNSLKVNQCRMQNSACSHYSCQQF